MHIHVSLVLMGFSACEPNRRSYVQIIWNNFVTHAENAWSRNNIGSFMY